MFDEGKNEAILSPGVLRRGFRATDDCWYISTYFTSYFRWNDIFGGEVMVTICKNSRKISYSADGNTSWQPVTMIIAKRFFTCRASHLGPGETGLNYSSRENHVLIAVYVCTVNQMKPPRNESYVSSLGVILCRVEIRFENSATRLSIDKQPLYEVVS